MKARARLGLDGQAGLPLAMILGLSLLLNVWHASFPLGFHFDEPVKLDFIKTGTQDFHHPLLMLQLVRAARLLVRADTDQQLVLLGRVLMGLCGVATVLLSFLLARHRMSRPWALGCGLAVAVSPILVMHAHYLDERTVFTASLVAATISFFHFVDRSGPTATLWLGLTTGLAWSSHFEGILLFPLFALAPLMSVGQLRQDFFARLFQSLLVAGGVFTVVNWPLFVDVQSFLSGMLHGVQHAASGNDVVLWGYQYLFGFHLVNSLAPGMTWPTLLVALSGMAWGAWRWARISFEERWIFAATLFFYLGAEIPPLKPWPDYAAYAIPVVPFLLFQAAQAAARLQKRSSSSSADLLVASAFVGVVVLYPLVDTIRLVDGLAHDTRNVAAAWLQANQGKVLVERYASTVPTEGVRSVTSVDANELKRLGIDYVLTSNFMYERFEVGHRLSGQDSSVYRAHERYEQLFAHPYIEILPAFRSYAFSNPIIRIVDLRTPAERLARPMRAMP